MENWPNECFALEFTLAALPRPLSAKESLAYTQDDDLDKRNNNTSSSAPCTGWQKWTLTTASLLRDGNNNGVCYSRIFRTPSPHRLVP